MRSRVCPVGSEHAVATFVPDWLGNGTRTVQGERTFRWPGKGLMRLEKLWQEDEGAPPLLGFTQVSGLKTDARVVLSAVAARLPETVELDDLYALVPPEKMSPSSLPLSEPALELRETNLCRSSLESVDNGARLRAG